MVGGARTSECHHQAEEITMRRQMWRFILAAAVLGLMAGAAAPARAGQISTFTAEGTFQDGATLSGTLTIDTTQGLASAANLTIAPIASLPILFTSVQAQGAITSPGGTHAYELFFSQTNGPELALFLPVPSLIDYPGGPITPIFDL